MKVIGIDHVQLAMPANSEDEARRFYNGLLGLPELPKPVALAGRGGVWFACGDRELHLGVETDFRPARKAHPALRVEGYRALIDILQDAGYEVREDTALAGVTRCFIADPFGNRIELMSADQHA